MAFTKQHIIDEIKRTAALNGDKPLGVRRFEQETGIAESDWEGRYWVRWGEAVAEAGYEPNQRQGAFSTDFLIEQLVTLVRELGHFPVVRELQMRRRRDKGFPHAKVFERRFGSKLALVEAVVAYCRTKPELEDVLSICKGIGPASNNAGGGENREEQIGYVYLLKSGRFHKIGKTNSVGRREYEIGIQLPEKVELVHEIKTDDPTGIESYWHKRFGDRRRNGEWFQLSSDDIRAFKKRKFM